MEGKKGHRDRRDYAEGAIRSPGFCLSQGLSKIPQCHITYPVLGTKVSFRFCCLQTSYYSKSSPALCEKEHFYYRLKGKQ